jgi:hypothetical protein
MSTLSTDLGFDETAVAGRISILPADHRIAPPRVLFQNGVVSFMTVELRRGQRLCFAQPDLSLLTVDSGGLRMWGPYGSFELQATGRWRLEEGERWKMRAMEDSTLSLILAETRPRLFTCQF